MRARLLVSALLVLVPSTVRAEWQVRPFVGVTFGGRTTLVDLEERAGDPKWTLGASTVIVGEVFGIEGDIAYTSGYFGEGRLFTASSVKTFTGNLYIALPRRWFQYTLRPYIVGGGGVIQVRADDFLNVLNLDQTLPAWDVGGGATGFLNDRVGVSWELRYFRGFSGDDPTGVSFGSETLSFFRAMMALTVRLDRNVP
ncbi:MAG TPA: hypothetical protein VNK41_06800 [Vicinamibacterales bacterium]|nr:hypothetical protein [Vicinamibacterales bacterium]